jgi:hypothetical protein
MELARQTFNTNALIRNAAAGGGAFLACTAIWALTSPDSDFWPRWVLVFTLVSIVRGFRRGARGNGPYRSRGRGGHRYSYRYEYHHGDGQDHEHRHNREG